MTDTDASAEERKLWADFYDAMLRMLEIMRKEGANASADVLRRVAAEQAAAEKLLARINGIRGIA